MEDNKTNLGTASMEAPAVAWTSYKRTDGFEVSITLRGEHGVKVLENLGKAIEQIKLEGGTPVSKNYGARPQQVTKMCTVHNVPMKQKISKKTNKPYFSHSRQTNGEWETCFGSGFDSEKLQPPVRDVGEDY